MFFSEMTVRNKAEAVPKYAMRVLVKTEPGIELGTCNRVKMEPDGQAPGIELDTCNRVKKEPDGQAPGGQAPGCQAPGAQATDGPAGRQEPGNLQPGRQEPGNQQPGNQEPGNQELLHYLKLLEGVHHQLEMCVILADAMASKYARVDALLVAAKSRGKISEHGTRCAFGYTIHATAVRECGGAARRYDRLLAVKCIVLGDGFAVTFVAPTLRVRVSVHRAGLVFFDVCMDDNGLAELATRVGRVRSDMLRVISELKAVSFFRKRAMRLECWGVRRPEGRRVLRDFVRCAGLPIA